MTSEATGTTANPLDSVRYTAGTDIGMRREENQDSFGVIKSENFRVFIVADGMGGVKGGATASGMAVNIIEQMLKDKQALDEGALIEGIGVANRMIFERGSNDSALNGMGTTLVALAFIDTRLLIANVGDSRAYLIRGDRIKRLTEDHTLVMELVRSGTISLEQAGNHPVSHMLTRSLGPTPEVEVDCFLSSDAPRSGDRYLLCSDGLYNLVTEGEMLEILNTYQLDDAIEVLIDLANQRGGTDNITTIVIALDEKYPVAPETSDPLAALAEYHAAHPQQSQTVAANGTPAATRGAATAEDTAQTSEATSAAVAEQATDQSSDPEGSSDNSIFSNFDPFSIPQMDPSEGSSQGITKDDESAEKTPLDSSQTFEPPKGDKQEARPNPIISGAVSFEQVAKDAGLSDEEISAAAAAAGVTIETVRIDQPTPARASRLSSRMLIVLGIIAGFLGGGLAVVLFNSGGVKKPQDPLLTMEPLPDIVDEPKVPDLPQVSSEQGEDVVIEPAEIELPDAGDPFPLTGPDNSTSPVETKPELPVVEPRIEPIGELPSDPMISGNATSEHLRKRMTNLELKITDFKAKIAMFDRPLAGVYGQALQNDNSKLEQFNSQISKVQTELDTATRKLSVWYGRRTRLQEADLTNLATEVAISSPDVKEKKESFELATWEYLKEAEVLRYLPTDKLQKKKVDELAEVRSRRMHELTDAVHAAIDREIQDSDSQIARLSSKKEQITEERESVNQDITFIKTLMSNDNEAKNNKRRELEKELEIAEMELKEVGQLLEKLNIQSTDRTPQLAPEAPSTAGLPETP